MTEKNIWDNLNLSEENLKTAYDYLIPQAENFKTATKSTLKMDLEVSNAVTSGENPRKVTVYSLYVVAPDLGNYRKKILHIAEFPEEGRFPVNMFSEVSEEKNLNVIESDFLTIAHKMLSHERIKGAIESLFRQSLQNKKHNS